MKVHFLFDAVHGRHSWKKGETADLPENLAVHLEQHGHAEFVKDAPAAPAAPKKKGRNGAGKKSDPDAGADPQKNDDPSGDQGGAEPGDEEDQESGS